MYVVSVVCKVPLRLVSVIVVRRGWRTRRLNSMVLLVRLTTLILMLWGRSLRVSLCMCLLMMNATTGLKSLS